MPKTLVEQNLLEFTYKDFETVYPGITHTKYEEIANNLSYYDITYYSNGKKIKGYLIEPKNLTSKIPVIIYNRGGSKDYGKIDNKQIIYHMTKLSLMGYIVIGSQYSGNGGSEGKDEFGGSDLDDVLNLRYVIKEIPNADEDRIGMYGASRGGMMTYLAMTKVEWIKAAVVVAGWTNIARSHVLRPNLVDWQKDMYHVQDESKVRERSILFSTDKLTKVTPIAIFHGTHDKQVDVLDTLELLPLLINIGISFSAHIFDGDDHYLTENKEVHFKLTKNWLDKHLLR